MNNHSFNWLRGFTVPFIALLVVAALVVYSAGFNNVLQFLGTKAATDEVADATGGEEESTTSDTETTDSSTDTTDSATSEDAAQDTDTAVEETTNNNDANEETLPMQRSLMIMLGSNANQAFPLSFKVVAAYDFGRNSLLEATVASFADSVVLDVNLVAGAYGLIVSAEGFIDQFIPFAVDAGAETIGIELSPMAASAMAETNFDLNNDGAINSLDLTVLLQQIGMQ